MAKSLIIGGLGFIGSHLVDECLSRGDEVTILTRSLRKQENIRAARERVGVVVRDLREIDREVENQDYIFNLSGTTDNYSIIDGNPFSDIEQNCFNTLHLLEAIKKHNPKSKLIFASTFFVNGRPQKLPVTPDQRCEPLGLYGATRLAGEHFCNIYGNVFDLNTTILRFCNVFGPREEGNKKKAGFNYLIRMAVSGKDLPVYKGGDFVRDYIYVTDVASACRTAAERGKSGEVYYVGRGDFVRFKELIDMVLKETGVKSYSVTPPDFHKRVGINDFVCDPRPLRDLGWNPQVSLEEGVRRTVEFYRGLK